MSWKFIRSVKIILKILSFIFFVFSGEGGFKTVVESTRVFILTGIIFRNFDNKQNLKLHWKLQGIWLLIFQDKLRILSHLKLFVELTLSDLMTLRRKTLLLLIYITEVFSVRLTIFYLKMFRGITVYLETEGWGEQGQHHTTAYLL
jgi:hypothetical protein